MTQPDTLHTRLRDELDRRLAVAKAATAGKWRVHTAGTSIRDSVPYAWVTNTPEGEPLINAILERYGGTLADVAHIALHDPADAIRRYTGELEVLERHAQTWHPGVFRRCPCCRMNHPCPELLSLAHRLGVSVDG